MKYYASIELSKDKITEVDFFMFPVLSRYKWNAQFNNKSGRWYAGASIGGISIAMHRFIMGLMPGDKRQVDHINPDYTLDNRIANLRICTNIENQWNRGLNKNNKSGHKGVCWNSKRKVWQSALIANKKTIWVGRWPEHELDEAVEARRIATLKYHGEFARLK